MTKKKWLFVAGIIVTIIISSALIISGNTNKNTKIQQTNQKIKKKIYEHTFPKRISKEDFFKGEFISNDTASIYPRREALVKDILVDIGDNVSVGDTLAILFRPGVLGEANSKINTKSTLFKTKNNLLSDIIDIKKAKLSEIDTKINEKEIIIKETEKNFNSKIVQLEKLIENKTNSENSSLENAENVIFVENENLNILSENLKNAIYSQKEKLNNSKNNISQKNDLLESKIEEILYNIIPIFYIGNKNDINYGRVNNYDLSDMFGAKNNLIKNELLNKISEFQDNKESLAVIKRYNDIIIINNLLINTLKNTIISISTTENNISNYITSINTYNSSLLTSKENYDDALNNYNILIKGENEKIGNLKKQIDKQKEIINLKKSTLNLINSGKTEKVENLEYELEKIKTEKSLNIERLKAELEVIRKSRNLLEANEEKNITSIQNEILIAKSNLNNEYISSGDYKITSPFNGTISKRNLYIGEKIPQNIEAFRLIGVENTLSKITKKEIKFYVPESLKDNLELNKEVYFSLGNNNNKSFTGIIYRISPEIDENNFTITVQAKVKDNIILPNKSTIRVSLKTTENIFSIPSTSIYNKEERKIIYYKKQNGKLGIKDINIISEDGEFSLVSGEFDEKLEVVTTPIFIK